MCVYIAMLRGINVGGHHKIKMSELRQMLEALGFTKVQTYIQSGNVLFAAGADAVAVRESIEEALAVYFGHSIAVILRTASEIECIVSHCPFSEEERGGAQVSSDVETLYVSMFSEPIPQDATDRLIATKYPHEKIRMVGKDVYLLLRGGIRNSKIANHLSRLHTPSTIRNWKTMNKLRDLARQTQS